MPEGLQLVVGPGVRERGILGERHLVAESGVGQDHDAARRGRGRRQAQLANGRFVAEEALAAAQDHREEEDPQLVNEVEIEQPRDEVGAPVDEDVAVAGASFRRRTSSSRLPRRIEVFAQLLSGRVFEITYFGSAVMRRDIGAAGSGAVGQNAAQMLNVVRPNRRALAP
jgi:hypothetical protein